MAVITDLGDVAGTGGILQPKIKNRWRVTFIGIGLNVIDGEGLTLQAVTGERPSYSFETITLDRYNSRGYVAGKYTFEPVNFVFEDDTGGAVAAALQNQVEKQQNLTAVAPSALLPASAAGQLYKFATRIDILDGGENIYESWSLEGCWLQALNYNDLDYAASESMKINTTIRYDHARQMITGQNWKMNPAQGAF